MMGLLEENLKQIEFTINNPAPGDCSYNDLIMCPPSYEWKNKDQQTFAFKATRELLDLIEKWESLKDPNATFNTDVPKPQPELRVKPQV